jgi:hypothetical protein
MSVHTSIQSPNKKEREEHSHTNPSTQPLPPQPLPHTLSYTKMTAPISSIQRYHCHPATATPHSMRVIFAMPPLFYFYFLFYSFFFISAFQTLISRSILPLPLPFSHHSNRLDPLYPTVPLSNCHCHSLVYKSTQLRVRPPPLPPSPHISIMRRRVARDVFAQISAVFPQFPQFFNFGGLAE